MPHTFTMGQVLGPDPEPEFRYCVRCDIDLKQGRDGNTCVDCKGVNAYKPTPRQTNNGGFPPLDPAYEVALHFRTTPRDDPNSRTLDALQIPYFIYTATKDPIEVAYAKGLLSLGECEQVPYPIVLITRHGEYLEHWTGYNLQALNALPAKRKAALGIPQTPRTAEAATQPGVPIREMEAA